MTDKSDIEIHAIEINGTKFRITNDPWTGDWLVDSPDELVQSCYFMTKQGAINWCLDRCGIITNTDYTFAPDRTSAD